MAKVMSTQLKYSDRVDRHIYVQNGCETVQDWCFLALAAIDQAGASQAQLHATRKQLMGVFSLNHCQECGGIGVMVYPRERICDDCNGTGFESTEK